MSKAKKQDKEEVGSEDQVKQALKLAQANAKAIEELREECRKGFAEHHNSVMLLKERNRLR